MYINTILFRFDHQNNARVNRKLISNIMSVCEKADEETYGVVLVKRELRMIDHASGCDIF